jgi:hypothetical protein
MVFWPIFYSWLIPYSSYPMRRKKNWNPDWYIKWIGDWQPVSALVFRPENPPTLFCGNPPPPINTALLGSERIGTLSSTPSTVGCFPRLYQELATRRHPSFNIKTVLQLWSLTSRSHAIICRPDLSRINSLTHSHLVVLILFYRRQFSKALIQ